MAALALLPRITTLVPQLRSIARPLGVRSFATADGSKPERTTVDKNQLIDLVAREMDIPKVYTTKVINRFLNEIVKNTISGEIDVGNGQ